MDYGESEDEFFSDFGAPRLDDGGGCAPSRVRR
jgi:hypothetical protein